MAPLLLLPMPLVAPRKITALALAGACAATAVWWASHATARPWDPDRKIVVTVSFVSYMGEAVAGFPPVTMQTTFVTGASPTARETAARRVTACRGPARLAGRRLEARCTPTPALAAALRKGTVRVTTKWYLRAPRQKATYPLGQARAYLSNRRAGAVTG